MVRVMNEWEQFKITNIKLKWYPTVKGKAMKVDVGYKPAFLNAEWEQHENGDRRDYECLMVLPSEPNGINHPGQDPELKYWCSMAVDQANAVTNDHLLQCKKPRVRRFNMSKNWSYSWRPMVMKAYQDPVITYTNTVLAFGAKASDPNAQKLAYFPWRPFLTPQYETGTGNNLVSTSLSVLIHQPFLAMRNTRDWVFEDDVRGLYGTLVLESTWKVRHKKASNAAIITNLTPAGMTITQSVLANVGNDVPLADRYV